jgi:hypothetical protein
MLDFNTVFVSKCLECLGTRTKDDFLWIVSNRWETFWVRFSKPEYITTDPGAAFFWRKTVL